MSSKTEFKCDFCGGLIVHATKSGARGYCGEKKGIDDTYIDWSHNPFDKMNGPHICEECVDSLIKSEAFNTSGMY